MSATLYKTASGSRYRVSDGMIRKDNAGDSERLAHWTPYRALNRVPAAVVRPGTPGEVLEILLDDEYCIITSQLTD